MNEDDYLAELEALFAQGQTPLPDDIIGGFFGGDPARQGGAAGIPYAPGKAPTVYLDGAQADVLKAMNTEQLARFQDALVATGLVRDVIPGHLDDGTLSGMTTLMALGNRKGVKWSDVLDGFVASGGKVGTADEFRPPVRLKPDYATLAQDVKGYVKQRLGRDFDEYEIQQLTGELSGFYQDEYEAQTELARMDFDASQGGPGGGSVVNVDPLARFKEMFEKRHAGEIGFNEARTQTHENLPRVDSIIESGLT